ncbi:MAG: hypothetical protein JXO49_04935 [Deltaproteobacteria bacterium]|nr:hypothetical protein [Candidatus Anaeroferrophillus wilburensis]MBN2888674.1 hypothetical protein [Deltaproteobacteria bacterium]
MNVLRYGMVLILLLPLVAGCGKKADPRPRRLVVPKAITDVNLDVRPGARFLVWSVPGENTDGSRPADIKEFVVFAKTLKQGDEGCVFCDEGFAVLAKVAVSRPEKGHRLGDRIYYPLPAVAADQLQAIKVLSVNRYGWQSEPSNKIKVYGFDAYGPPAEVQCDPGASVVTVTWMAPKSESSSSVVPEIYGYRGYRQGEDGDWLRITPEILTDRQLVDVGLKDWQSYTYAVTTVSTYQGTPWESRLSQPVAVVPGDYTVPGPVQGFTAFAHQGGVQLIWQASREPDLLFYRVYKYEVDTGKSYILELPPPATDYFDSAIMAGRQYGYRISAVDSSARHNESDLSPEQKVLVK